MWFLGNSLHRCCHFFAWRTERFGVKPVIENVSSREKSSYVLFPYLCSECLMLSFLITQRGGHSPVLKFYVPSRPREWEMALCMLTSLIFWWPLRKGPLFNIFFLSFFPFFLFKKCNHGYHTLHRNIFFLSAFNWMSEGLNYELLCVLCRINTDW